MTVAVPISAFVLSGFLYFTFRDVSRMLVVYFVVVDWVLLAMLRAVAVRGHVLRKGALIGAGVGAVVARDFARIFFRNAINIGLLVVEAPERDVPDPAGQHLAPVFADLTPLNPPTGTALRRAVVQPALQCVPPSQDGQRPLSACHPASPGPHCQHGC